MATDPPAADRDGVSFFLKAAHYRPRPRGTEGAGATMLKAVRFLLSDAGIENNAIRDEQGRNVPPYIYHAVIDPDNHFSYRVSYPAFRHAYLIEAFLDYYNYSGDDRGIERARHLADWTISHSTPADYNWPYL